MANLTSDVQGKRLKPPGLTEKTYYQGDSQNKGAMLVYRRATEKWPEVHQGRNFYVQGSAQEICSEEVAQEAHEISERIPK